MKSHQIRQMFLEFFDQNNHKIIDSAPLVIKDDPTLMFTNAGMNQFKNIFLNIDKPKDLRVVNSQKCLRVSGKHNDLEEVGHDTYHHTMFEMLGNWSFGDYSKEKAIDLAWEFLTTKCKLNTSRIYVTVFEGSSSENLKEDKDSYAFWSKYLPKNRILFSDKKDNFWEMGDYGPCGPCTEIHYDNRIQKECDKIDGRELVNNDHPQVIEIWNLVFIQFNRKKNGDLEKLSSLQVDTGMGLERLCMIMQNVKSNYDTDIFMPIISNISSMSNKEYGQKEECDIAMRVISDHIRAVAFSIADGQLPSNNKAGYVIRRILRRAIRYGYTFLAQRDPFIYKLVDSLTNTMGNHFKELNAQKDLITKVILQEEVSFLRTLDSGLKRLDNLISQKKKISGANVFELYDTFGFPKDLTSLILKEHNLEFDEKEFDTEMDKQRNRSNKSSNFDFGEWSLINKNSREIFVGYQKREIKTKITRYRTNQSKDNTEYHIVLDETPFYPESGGQVGDRGYLISESQKIKISDTKKENNLIYHVTDDLPENLNVTFDAIINTESRKSISRNHSATHLLHYQLRKVLGDHVVQKGSLVDQNYFRFDFSHHSSVTIDVLNRIEKHVNDMIFQNIELKEKNDFAIEKAKEMGALMLFGEKYDDKVRVIQFGESIELCGGTHVQSTSQIGIFKILSESSVASGVRRIEATTGPAALSLLNKNYQIVKEAEKMLKTKDLIISINKLVNETRSLEKKYQILEKESLSLLIDEQIKNSEKFGEIDFMSNKLQIDSKNLKEISFLLKEKENLVAVFAVFADAKINIGLYISSNLVKSTFNANDIIKLMAEKISGSGGGQPHFAVAGGTDTLGFDDAVNLVIDLLKKR